MVNLMVITEDNLILPPGDYLVFTEDATILKADYPGGDESKSVVVDLPTYPNEEGSVILIDPMANVIDAFDYKEDFHFSLLDDVEGVSLERISIDAPTQDPDNWKSAASTVGFATPGLKNSHSFNIPDQSKALTVSPRIITPDNSGDADFATINFAFENGNNIATVSIFDAAGRPVKKLLENASLPAKGFITWDGTNDRLQKVRIGYYIIHFEVFDSTGKIRIMKERIVVGSRF